MTISAALPAAQGTAAAPSTSAPQPAAASQSPNTPAAISLVMKPVDQSSNSARSQQRPGQDPLPYDEQLPNRIQRKYHRGTRPGMIVNTYA